MPASSQGLPTSRMRSTGRAAAAAGDLDSVDVGAVGAVALELVPALDGALLELGLGADDLEVAAGLALEDRQGEAVVALLRDHPVVHVAQPVELAGQAEVRDPVAPCSVTAAIASRRRRFRGRRRAVAVHGDEPLVDQAEDELAAAAPAVGVAVRVVLDAVEHALLSQAGEDVLRARRRRSGPRGSRSRRRRCRCRPPPAAR